MTSEHRSRLGLLFAAANVLALMVLLASKPAEYDRLRAEDVSAGWVESESPFYVAGRPLYAGGLLLVPPHERAFAFVNLPAIFAAEITAPVLANAVTPSLAGSVRASSAAESWVAAGVLFPTAALWAYVVGTVFEVLRRIRRAA